MDLITFPPLDRFPWLVHGFITRQHGVDANGPREDVIACLREGHRMVFTTLGIEWSHLRLPEQVHGNYVEVVDDKETGSQIRNPHSAIANADGLVTTSVNVPLGIHVADCCAVFLVETRHRAIGLLHSGRRGTEGNIVRQGIRELTTLSGGNPSDVVAVLSPCIHGCCYDVDFVAQIERQLRDEGVEEVWRHPDCTGCHMDRYYSYRKEKGRTGRMLAFAMIRTTAA